jgi:hypothetical protein
MEKTFYNYLDLSFNLYTKSVLLPLSRTLQITKILQKIQKNNVDLFLREIFNIFLIDMNQNSGDIKNSSIEEIKASLSLYLQKLLSEISHMPSDNSSLIKQYLVDLSYLINASMKK